MSPRRYVEVDLVTGEHRLALTKGMYTIVDECDARWVEGWNWQYLSPHGGRPLGYAIRDVPRPGKRVRLHVALVERIGIVVPPGQEIDHINRNGLDNRRANLRIVPHALNARNQPLSRANTSGFKGVTWNRRKRRWQAQIMVNGRNHWLGNFERLEDAAAAYVEGSKRLHGEFGYTGE